MFLPIKPDFRMQRFPLLTTIVCVICAIVFAGQELDRYEYNRAVDNFCDMQRSRLQEIVFRRIEEIHRFEYCDDIAYVLHNATDKTDMLERLMNGMRPLSGFDAEESREYVSQMLLDEAARYRQLVPPDPDEGLAYYSESWNPWTMLTSSFAHGDWAHIVFNLIFFVAFGTMVEMLIGWIPYIGLIIAISLLNGVFTSLSTLSSGVPVLSLGLSGVVMGMIGLSAYLLPRAKIRCYYWFIILFGSVALPIWALALWYIGGDIYTLFAYEDHGMINVMAHVTGGIGGYLFGILFLRQARLDAQGVQMTIDRSALRPKFF